MRTRVVAVAFAAILMLSGCSAAATSATPETQAPAPSATPELQPVPSSTNRVRDPAQTGTNGALVSPDQAPISQLWAASGFNDTNSGSGFDLRNAAPSAIAHGLDDFAPAIESRCYPVIDGDQLAELTALKAAFDTAAADSATTSENLYAAGKAYFDRATALCL